MAEAGEVPKVAHAKGKFSLLAEKFGDAVRVLSEFRTTFCRREERDEGEASYTYL